MRFLRAISPVHRWAIGGYALFLAANATVVWGGVFPFLPAGFQTEPLMRSFFMMQATALASCLFLGAWGAYRRAPLARRASVAPAAAPYIAGWLCLIAAMYLPGAERALVCVGGACIGVGSAAFLVAWQRVFAGWRADLANRDIILATLFAPMLYFLFYLVPIAVTSLIIPLVLTPLSCLALVLSGRTVDFDAPMFSKDPRGNPTLHAAYRTALRDYWRCALAIGTLAFACGAVRALVVVDMPSGARLNATSMVALFAAAVVLVAVWTGRPLRVNLGMVFRVFFPFVTTAVVLLPVLGQRYLAGLASVLYALYTCSLALMMVQCAQAARDRQLDPVFIYGFVAGTVYALHDLGYAASEGVRAVRLFGGDPLVTVACASVYALGIMLYLYTGGLRGAVQPGVRAFGNVEFVLTAALPQRRRASAVPVPGAAERPVVGSYPPDETPVFRDRTSKQCALMQRHFKLSDREAQVIELLARGQTYPGIAEALAVSENTVRTHIKRVYAKIGVHKKQELLDLVRSFDPSALGDA